jgi:hypothetical protein
MKCEIGNGYYFIGKINFRNHPRTNRLGLVSVPELADRLQPDISANIIAMMYFTAFVVKF